MNEKAKKFLLDRQAGLSNATRYADGEERLKYDMEFVEKYVRGGGVCIDLCCGTGMMTVEMAKTAKKVYAVDFNENFLEQIPKDEKIVKIVSDANSVKIDEKVDLITIFGAIQYNTGNDVKMIYENCYKMLKPEGVLVVSGQWGVKETVVVDNFSEELQKNYFAEYRTTDEETALLQSIGFKTDVVRILPEQFNRFDNTHFWGIVATRPKVNIPIPKYKNTIGIVGGMGSYATLDFFARLLNAFPAEKEWNRPRIIIDNRCTMPSRVRAILYDENYDYVLSLLVDSVKNLLNGGADMLVLACNTSHAFLDDILKNVPEAMGKVVNIIDALGMELQQKNNCECEYRLLASEGTIESRVYQKYLSKYGIKIETPSESEYRKLRAIIEDVKQNIINSETEEKFKNLIEGSLCKNIIIGCTEFPVLYNRTKNYWQAKDYCIYDPLNAALNEIKRRIK